MALDMTTHGMIGFSGSETSACSGNDFKRHSDARHRHHDAGVPGRDDADLFRRDGAARRLDPANRPARRRAGSP